VGLSNPHRSFELEEAAWHPVALLAKATRRGACQATLHLCYVMGCTGLGATVHRRSSALTNFGWSVLYIRLQS
jgi:hypothetical protein